MIGFSKSNTRGLAYVNHGRWIVDCPVCGSPLPFTPERESEIACPVCNPRLWAVKFVPIPNDPDNGFRQVPDQKIRDEERRNSPSFKPVLPERWKEIFDALRKRRTENMNWLPGESLEKIIAENIEHLVQEA